jgi:hypothetical protein
VYARRRRLETRCLNYATQLSNYSKAADATFAAPPSAQEMAKRLLRSLLFDASFALRFLSQTLAGQAKPRFSPADTGAAGWNYRMADLWL